MMERRDTIVPAARPRVERRAKVGTIITGYAAVFYDRSDPGTQFFIDDEVVERIMPGAFDRALRERHDVRALFDHSSLWVLGRTASGTCTLSVDKKGLRYEVIASSSPLVAHVLSAIDRGDVDGSSFAFSPTSVRWERDGNLDVRQIFDLDLFDVSPVTYPAYAAATSALRGELPVRLAAERDGYIAGQSRVSAEEVAVRLRMLELDDQNERERSLARR
jgi:HK97 family phage prohead protease